MNEKIFPVVMISLSLAAGIVYAFHQEWRKCLYFLFAAALTATQVF